MKNTITYLSFVFYCCLLSLYSFSQNQPVVLSNSENTYFIEGKRTDKNNWYLDASLKLDVYELDKTSKATWVYFHTDIDSLKVKLKPGETFDFVVLLNGKDSCFTQIKNPAMITKYRDQLTITQDTIPFELTEANNIKIQTVMNGEDTLDLHFDTGASALVLTHEAIKEKTNLLSFEKEGYETRDYRRLNSLNKLKIGNEEWDNILVYPVSLSPKGTDGHFSWNLFDGRMVEVDYDHSRLVIHSSLAKKPKKYTKLKMEHIHTLFCVQGKLKINGKKYKNRYLVDSGYQRAILLDKELNADDAFPKDIPTIKETKLKNGQGQVFITKIINTPSFQLGNKKVFNIPTQLLSVDNPARFKTHILGNEFLKRFNTIFDFQNNLVYLKPNSLMKEKYVDAS